MPGARGKKHKPGRDGMEAPAPGGAHSRGQVRVGPWQVEVGPKRAGGTKETA